ncbi:hypothetical protein G9A89_004969 [Geosiphon pyriformis]|nr:hypothetical protein G9A89_004969 [Geosiphon pyriformis]
MFILSVFSDTVKIAPSNFQKNRYEAITDQINQKYANKVVHDLGLCICLYDILEAGEEFLYHGSEGASFVKVKFRLVVFRPFIGEVLVGKIHHCRVDQIRVTLGFFDDIRIPAALIRRQMTFDHHYQGFVWDYGEGCMWLQKGDLIRFRVHAESFADTTPTELRGSARPRHWTRNSLRVAPYELICSLQEDGAGPCDYWED